MYRQRNYKKTERIMIKGVAALNWFTGVNLDDPYKQGWKGRVRRKGQFKNKETKDEKFKKENLEVEITTKMFIPPTPGSKLLKKMMDIEAIFQNEKKIEWGVKLVEKSGVSLINCLRTRLPIEMGCPLGTDCVVCNQDALNCTPKGVVYRASCSECKVKRNEEVAYRYIGETSRPLRSRALEPMKKLEALDEESLMLSHC